MSVLQIMEAFVDISSKILINLKLAKVIIKFIVIAKSYGENYDIGKKVNIEKYKKCKHHTKLRIFETEAIFF